MRDDPSVRELARVDFVFELHGYAGSLRGIWSDHRPEDASAAVKTGGSLVIVQKRCGKSAAVGEPGEVLAVPVVSRLVVVVGVVVPQPEQFPSVICAQHVRNRRHIRESNQRLLQSSQHCIHHPRLIRPAVSLEGLAIAVRMIQAGDEKATVMNVLHVHRNTGLPDDDRLLAQ